MSHYLSKNKTNQQNPKQTQKRERKKKIKAFILQEVIFPSEFYSFSPTLKIFFSFSAKFSEKFALTVLKDVYVVTVK